MVSLHGTPSWRTVRFWKIVLLSSAALLAGMAFTLGIQSLKAFTLNEILELGFDVAKNPTSNESPAPDTNLPIPADENIPSNQQPTAGSSVVYPQFSAINVRGPLVSQGSTDTDLKTETLDFYDDVQVWGRLNLPQGLTNTGPDAIPGR